MGPAVALVLALNVLQPAVEPPPGERIEFSNAYHPWRDGAPLRYLSPFSD